MIILAAPDLGASGQHVLEGAATLASWADARLHVVHVSETVSFSAIHSAAGRTALIRERDQLGRLVQRYCNRRVDSQEVLTGKAAETISVRARALRADVIVLGAHTAANLGATVFGTTAQRVVHSATVSCLIVRAALPQTLTTVAVGTDFSPPSVAAAHLVASWLREFGEPSPRLHLLHVGWPMDRLADPELENRVLRPQLQELEQQLASAGPIAIQSHVIWSNPPAAALTEWARQHDCELLVLGTTGRSGLRDLLLGSVAISVARQAQCAVLLVPAERD
jgi:nucleotide-binding universal stress UspA family protein